MWEYKLCVHLNKYRNNSKIWHNKVQQEVKVSFFDSSVVPVVCLLSRRQQPQRGGTIVMKGDDYNRHLPLNFAVVLIFWPQIRRESSPRFNFLLQTLVPSSGGGGGKKTWRSLLSLHLHPRFGDDKSTQVKNKNRKNENSEIKFFFCRTREIPWPRGSKVTSRLSQVELCRLSAAGSSKCRFYKGIHPKHAATRILLFFVSADVPRCFQQLEQDLMPPQRRPPLTHN